MNKMLKNSLMMLAVGAFFASCADYNDVNNYSAAPDPTYSLPYADLRAVKSYIDKDANPNMFVDTKIDLNKFNKQALDHAAAVTNFNGVAFGASFMPGKYVGNKGYMNFMDLKNALDHTSAIGLPVYGSPIVANENQPDGWFSTLLAPIEIKVLPIVDKEVDYSHMDEFTGTYKGKSKPVIVKNFDDKGNVLMLPTKSKVYIIENENDDFILDPQGYYTITFSVKSNYDKEESINCTFADSTVMSGKDPKKFVIRPETWQTVKVEAVPAKDATNAYLRIEGNLNAVLYIRDVHAEHTPDNHRDQTKEEMNVNIHSALDKWCDGLMEANAGRIKWFDLIDKPLDTKSLADNPDILDLKHSTEKVFWQDYLEEGNFTGSEMYGATVYRVAKTAFEKHGGNPADLKFFISETGLEDQKRFESLKYWMEVWESNMSGEKFHGINAELNLIYSEDENTQAANEVALNVFLDNLKSTGRLIRLSNFDIKYQDAEGNSVTADAITTVQRQKLADYYAYVINAYMTRIPNEQKAGLCKGGMVDSKDPIGLWSLKGTEWVRNATYEAFCNALSGKKN